MDLHHRRKKNSDWLIVILPTHNRNVSRHSTICAPTSEISVIGCYFCCATKLTMAESWYANPNTRIYDGFNVIWNGIRPRGFVLRRLSFSVRMTSQTNTPTHINSAKGTCLRMYTLVEVLYLIFTRVAIHLGQAIQVFAAALISVTSFAR